MSYKKQESVYPVLEAEIARKGIKKKDISETIGIGARTLSLKLLGKSDFTLSEALVIHQNYFDDILIEELFKKSGEALSHSAKNR
ncbi:MAG: hypothetical protein SOZ56_03995 [Oscillospiraceae bacterium]|nr:hypothetical protein [Oscillospiraceae bacterium]